jgi:hypothetical protein
VNSASLSGGTRPPWLSSRWGKSRPFAPFSGKSRLKAGASSSPTVSHARRVCHVIAAGVHTRVLAAITKAGRVSAAGTACHFLLVRRQDAVAGTAKEVEKLSGICLPIAMDVPASTCPDDSYFD